MPNRPSHCLCGVVTLAAIFCFANISCCHAAEPDQSSQPGKDRLVVHEWGTFTSLQDERGDAIGGINEDDEPVPEFVHRIASFLLLGPGANIPINYQGAPQCHPDVTMRLETPVVYFHPSPNDTLPFSIKVEVAFKSGWLSEYYPAADVEAPGVKGEMSFGPIRADTVGRLRWKNLQVGAGGNAPDTSSPVWLTPRAVQSAAVTSADGEHEQFLFYRGVGHVDSPLRVSRKASNHSLVITADFRAAQQTAPTPSAMRKIWLTEIRDDKSCAFRELSGFEVQTTGKTHIVATTPDTFHVSDFHVDNVAKLCASMRSALIEDGLFPDEADALLNTWRLSYFESPGLRLFYLLPRSWTDRVLPMQISRDANLVRTMVGRIEIVTPDERRLLRQIAKGPASNADWSRPGVATRQPMPDDFRAYSKLGRFRNALLLDELKHRPTAALQKFIDGYGLKGYRVQQPEATNLSGSN